jgi:peptidoglycan/xylan/chitin deacetylase (PgdA/CDA1 family)
MILARPVVLVYHGVGSASDEEDPRRLLVSPEHLDSHVRLLKRRGYGFVPAGELAGNGAPRGRTASLTFDDGWRNGLTTAVPVLERLGVPGTFFVCPGLFGATHPDVPGESGALLNESEAGRLHEAGMELGSHSLTHPDLRHLSDGELAVELRDSKEAVEGITGKPCRIFAYPYGLYDERVVRAVGSAGYELAFAWLPGPWLPLQAPRLPAPPRHGAGRLALKLLGFRRRGR